MPDPKLEAVRAEIKEILRKYDVAGAVIVASQTHAIYSLNLDASWNCATTTEGPTDTFTRFLVTQAVPDPEKKVIITNTINSIFGMHEAGRQLMEQIQTAAGVFTKHFDISHIARNEREGQ